MKKFYVLRVENEDRWVAHKGEEFTSSSKNIHVFKEKSLTERLEHAKRISKETGLPIVSEDW